MDATADDVRDLLTQAKVDPATLRPLLDLASNGTVYVVGVPGKDAVAAWERLRLMTSRSGFYPVIVGEDDFGDEPEYDDQTPAQAEADLTAAAVLDTDGWLAERLVDHEAEWTEANPEDGVEDETNGPIPAPAKVAPINKAAANAAKLEQVPPDPSTLSVAAAAEFADDWPEGVPEKVPAGKVAKPDFHFAAELSKPGKTAAIALAPTRNGYEVPAMLGFGGYNACPEPAEQSAVLNRWYNSHRAQLVYLHAEVVELRVDRPPTTRDAASQIALEHYTFAPDVVEQGAGSIGHLAASLMGAGHWTLWWD